ncbi:multidrug resistance-associated protein 1-like isoform X2 [Haliotis rufescens]|uniref:multidrug resistance-associated protein 1-like isoform X2 n=1 Tax=Haliotis rufescens TaxID=6454 RepID=UPI00201F8E3A|nr:multidrug resistance-associated protein 1-like isoform X2 [Haliotis rufescens]
MYHETLSSHQNSLGMAENDSFEAFCGGAIFNESLLLDSSWPRFTECFEESLVVWVPCGWLWVSLPFYLTYLCHQDGVSIPINPLNTLKTFFSLFLSFLAVIDLIKAASDGENEKIYDVVYVSGGIKAGTFLLATILIQLERKRGIITSGVLWFFWLLTTLANIIPFYTKIIQEDYNGHIFRFSIFYIYFALMLLELVLHCFAEKMTRAGYYDLGKKPSPEQESSFLNRITFWWINSMVFTGYRKGLEEADMFELHPRDKSERVVPQFNNAWDKEIHRSKLINEKKRHLQVHYRRSLGSKQHLAIQSTNEKTPLLHDPIKNKEVKFKGTKDDDGIKLKEASLFKVLAKTYWLEIAVSWFCKFIYDLLQFVSPMLLNALISYTQNRESEQEWKGYVFACSFFVVATVQSVFSHQNYHLGMTLGMRIKSACISAVFKKALTISNEAKKESTMGEIVNLMSVDCQRLQDVTAYLWMLWSAPLQISLALYMLYSTMGASVFAGLGVMVLLMPINAFIATKQRNYQVEQMKCKDNRLKLMNEVLNGMKVLKLYAWEPSFQEKVLEIRNKELLVLKKGAYLEAGSTFCFTCAPFMVTLATFATYVLASESHYLDAQKAFVALSLFNILRFPITLLPLMVSFLVQAQVSVGRVGKFLRQGDLDPSNVTRDPHTQHAISLKNGTFTWDKTSPTATLKNVNLDIPDGKLVAVVGQVGAGKSSLISAFLGEMEKLQGSVTLKSSIAYVPQQAWIQNATLKDNILFGKNCDSHRYKKIIDACALQPDLDILTGGDQTEIGEKGINLSGGQKQRVSLARAVYSDADIYLLDDPLSAVDSHVGKHIFQEVVGSKGILKSKTRVLVTHGVHWLPMVDQIVVMVDGEISELGSYEELLSHDGPFAQFLKMYLTEDIEDDDDIDDEDPEILAMKSKIRQRVDSITSETVTSDEQRAAQSPRRMSRRFSRTLSMSKDTEKPGALEKKEEKNKDKLIEEEKSETGKVKASVYIDYARAIGYFTTFMIFVIYGIYQFANAYSSVWLSQWTDDPLLKNQTLANTPDYQNRNALYLGVYGGLGVAQAIGVLCYSLLASTRMVRAAGNLHAKMLSNILRSPMSFFDTTPIGRIVNRFSRDVETVDNNLPSLLRQWINMVFNVISTIIVISYSTPIFLVVIIPLGFLYWLVQRFYIPTSRQLKRIESTTRSPIYTHFSETITGASSIRAYGATDRFYTESQERVDKNLVFYFAGIASNRWLGFRLEFLGNIIVLAAAMFAVITEDIEGGLVGLSVSYALQVTASLNWMVRMTSEVETNVVSVERLKEYSETPTEAEWILDHHRPPPSWPQNGKVNFVNYATRYRPGLDLVLKGISCEINESEKVGIVGRTGAGKSSMTVALFRLIEAASGSIIIDGTTAGNIGLHDLRSKLTILPQDPVLFSGTMRMNLDPFDKYSDAQIWKALAHAHLKKFVQELPVQLEYECGEGGQNLSVGQRQLVCLARTLLRKTKILILDEATAAVDMETDDLIQQTIRTEFKDCTVLTIAHRLNTILDYDKIIVLDQGLIKEFDSPDTLLKDKTSIFYGMAKDAGLTS